MQGRGIPCNQFGGQEQGDAAQIGAFCSTTYDVSFPMFAKVEVNGAGTDPLYAFLKHEKKGVLGTEAIKWNFTKFLIGKNGEVVKRYVPGDGSRQHRYLHLMYVCIQRQPLQVMLSCWT